MLSVRQCLTIAQFASFTEDNECLNISNLLDVSKSYECDYVI